jgi:hypothetical protein
VLYAAHATLRRGYAYDAGQGHAWVTGSGGSVSRFVESHAAKARVAHLVSGYRDSGGRSSMLLGDTPLYYFNDQAPTWWHSTLDASWTVYPNNTSPKTGVGLAFWADVCASWCVRRFEDESEFFDIDFTVSYETANWGRCSCYAYQDTELTSSHAHKNSHAAPDDLRAMEWLHTFYKIPSNQPNDAHVYAMKKDVGNGLWIPRLQSTLYYSKLWQAEIDAPQGSMDNAPALATKAHLFYGVSSLSACLERCSDEAVSAVRALRTVRFDPADESCRCFDESLFQWKFDSNDDPNNLLWTRDGDSTAQWYDVRFCEFVRPDTVRTPTRTTHTHTHSFGRCSKTDMSTTRLCPQHGRTMVWSKSLQLPGQADGWCSGSPAGAGALSRTHTHALIPTISAQPFLTPNRSLSQVTLSNPGRFWNRTQTARARR